MRQFLQNIDEHFAFYHERFREFVIERYVYPDELRTYHARIARWLIGCDSRYADDRWKSLARHVYESGDYDTFSRVIDGTFLTGKLRRFGYAVLEDIDLLARVLLDGMEPMAIERCMNVLDL